MLNLTGAAGGAAGSIVSTIGNLIKKKVKAPDFIPVDTSKEIGRATAANQANLPAIQQLASETNQFTQEQLLGALRAAIPDLEKINEQASKNLEAQLAGRLPEDVIGAINRSTAAQNQAAGVGGSQFGRNLTARDMGLTSLQLMNQGFANATNWLSNVRQNQVGPQFDVSSMFISPAQQIQVTAANNEGQMRSQFLKSQLDALQAPRSIIGQGMNQFGQSLGSMGSMGGLGGGGGGGGGGFNMSYQPVNFGSSGFGSFGLSYGG